MKTFSMTVLLPVLAALGGCASGPAANDFKGTTYRCDDGVEVQVKSGESATLQTGHGAELLLLDAGGVGPQQKVYSNPKMRFSTGLDPDGKGAYLEGLVPNGKARCKAVSFFGT